MAIIHVEDQDEELYRNELSSIHAQDGRRKWIYAKEPHGKYTKARTVVAAVLLVFLFGAPFVRVHDAPFMLLNIVERNFIIFGFRFWPQDFHLLVLSFLGLLVTIVLFTAIYGRIWCGWACPQTIFMEMVFRKLEYWFEGGPKAQQKLDKSPWNANKILRRGGKHVVFYGVSFLIANTFLAYIVGTDQLWKIVTDDPRLHLGGLTAITLFTTVFYLVFARFREQACIIVCPYGRYQSALVDENTTLVTYDFKRGEPRKRYTKEDKLGIKSQEPRGDCIECHQCIDVCPTGIDIRNGIQLECVNCTACIDACDEVMTKINKPTGLIRYASLNSIKEGVPHVFTTRIKAYVGVWLALMSVLVYLYATRPDTETIIVRQPKTLYTKTGDNQITNFFMVKVINKTFEDKPIRIQVSGLQGATLTLLTPIDIAPKQSVTETRFMISAPQQTLTSRTHPMVFTVLSGDKIVEEIKSTFLGPEK